MSTHRGGNGGSWPPDGDRPSEERPELPEVPSDWTEVAIPDDLSELAEEAAQVRRELAREARWEVWRHRFGLGSAGQSGPSLAIPLLIMSIAVMLTLISLFAMAWPGPDGADPGPSGTVTLPAVNLTRADGTPLALAPLFPAVIMLVEECDCVELVDATAAEAPAGITVLAVGHTVPTSSPGAGPVDGTVVWAADPDGRLRADLGLGPPTTAASVLLVDRDGKIVRTVSAAQDVATYQADLSSLATG